MNTAGKLQVLDPTVGSFPEGAVIAKRPASLEGSSLGLLANGKHNADTLLEMVREVLADRFDFRNVVSADKGNASRPSPKKLLLDMARDCDVVITASGD